MNNLIYVYCISNSPLKSIDDMEGRGLRSLVLDNFHVIIRDVPESEFSEENFKKNQSDIQWVEFNTREHVEMISKIMESGNVIPFKFGTIFNTEGGLQEFIADYSASLNDNFSYIEGKEEWSVRTFCNREMLSEQIDELSEEAALLEKQIMASSPGKAFLLRRKKTELIENEMDRLCKIYAQGYYDEFENLSVATCLNNLLPKELTEREDSMILNAAFLVYKERASEFKSMAGFLTKKDGNLGFYIEANGPWPTFSFISLKEKQ
jgi:hypothetical protein